jgi:hypothetical protein
VLGKLPVHIVVELALVTDSPSAFEDPYTALKERLLAAYGRSKWEELDSLLNFLKMGVNERPSVVSGAPQHSQASVLGGALHGHLPPGAAGQTACGK